MTRTGSTLARTLALLAAVTFLGSRSAPPTVFDLDRIGRPVPDVTLTTLEGAPLALASMRGMPVYVVLFASWCEPCMLEMPWIREAHAAYGERLRILGVDVLESHAAARAFLEREGLPFDTAILDEASLDAVVSEAARLRSGDRYRLPANYLIDAAGIVRDAWHGVPVERDGTPIDVLPAHLARLGLTTQS